MKVLLTTLNSKFIHSSLALKYIYNNIYDLPNVEVFIKEYTINESPEHIFSDIMSNDYDMIAFSCYIWNIEYITRLCQDIKSTKKDVMILLGGPEVSYDSIDFMQRHNYVDFIIRDEGELVFRCLLTAWNDNKDYTDIKSLTYRKCDEIIENDYENPIDDLGSISGAYDVFDEQSIKDKIVYYETSRGCCYNCSYCLSSVTKQVRFFPYEKVKSDLKKIVDLGAKQVKFVDRTFNVDKKRTIELIKYLCSLDNGFINFHFEITAHILEDEILEYLKSVRQGLFQFEIGVQSTNKDTIVSVNRVDDFKKLSEKVKKIKSFNNIHQHLDLIAGLPYEDINSFKRSFNDVMSLRPDNLQLAFLKVLKGSPIERDVQKYDIKYRQYPPYEVISTKFLSYEEIFILKEVEKILDDYYNSMTYNYSIDYIFSSDDIDYFSFFENFAKFKKDNNYNLNLSRDDRFYLFYDYVKTIFSSEQLEVFREFLRLDFLLMGRNRNIPVFLRNESIKIDNFKKKEIIMQYIEKNLSIEYKDKIQINKSVNEYNIEPFYIDFSKFIKDKCVCLKKIFVIFDYSKEKNFKNMIQHEFISATLR